MGNERGRERKKAVVFVDDGECRDISQSRPLFFVDSTAQLGRLELGTRPHKPDSAFSPLCRGESAARRSIVHREEDLIVNPPLVRRRRHLRGQRATSRPPFCPSERNAISSPTAVARREEAQWEKVITFYILE